MKTLRQNRSVLLYSTEIEEVVNLSDRVLVFYGGEIIRAIPHPEITEEAIMETVLGQNEFAAGTGRSETHA